MKKDKVYCVKCRYYKDYMLSERVVCKHPNAIEVDETWCNPKRIIRLSPAQINKNNDCGCYERK